jgi:hypothetical protein
MIRTYYRSMSIVVLFLGFGVLYLPAQGTDQTTANPRTAKPAAQAAHTTAKTSPAQGAAKPNANPETEHDLADSDIKAIKQPPLPPFHPQEPKRIQLSNGMVIFLQEDHELPRAPRSFAADQPQSLRTRSAWSPFMQVHGAPAVRRLKRATSLTTSWKRALPTWKPVEAQFRPPCGCRA